MLSFLVLVAVMAVSMVLLARFLYREERRTPPPAAAAPASEPEQVGLGEPEWRVVMREQCLPIQCPDLKGSPPRPGKEPGCQVCAALFLQRYGERILKPQREQRNR